VREKRRFLTDFACELEHMECWKGGRTWLEFGLDGVMFALCLIVMCVYREHLKPYESSSSASAEKEGEEGTVVVKAKVVPAESKELTCMI